MERHLALVTGAGRGIGFAIAQALAQDDVRVAVVDRDHAQEAAHRLGAGHEGFACDLADQTALAPMVNNIVQKMGRTPDIFVHCAGIFPNAPLNKLDLNLWRSVYAVNVDAAMWLAQALAPAMIAQAWGRMVMISSGTIGIIRRDVSPYISSKMAIIGLVRALAADLGAHGICVNAVAPGFMLTEGTVGKFQGDMDALAASIAAKQAIPHLGTPEDIAETTRFLCSDGARHIQGQTWMVDGGWYKM